MPPTLKCVKTIWGYQQCLTQDIKLPLWISGRPRNFGRGVQVQLDYCDKISCQTGQQKHLGFGQAKYGEAVKQLIICVKWRKFSEFTNLWDHICWCHTVNRIAWSSSRWVCRTYSATPDICMAMFIDINPRGKNLFSDALVFGQTCRGWILESVDIVAVTLDWLGSNTSNSFVTGNYCSRWS